MKIIFALFTGLVFGVGISLSGMIDPAKVVNFFDIAGTWDPSLIFVMGGGLVVSFIGYRLVRRRKAPLFGGQFDKHPGTLIDKKLIGGSALFGIGWGIAGFCPGAAIPALATGKWEVALFIIAMFIGFYARRFVSGMSPKLAN